MNIIPLRKCTWYDFIYFLFGRIKLHKVSGFSMQPLLRDGDLVLVSNNIAGSPFEKGTLVQFQHPYKPIKVIKYIKYYDPIKRSYWMQGLNPDYSIDSRNYGLVAEQNVQGQVLCVIPNDK